MRSIVELVKENFDTCKARTNEKKSGLQTFWTSNDFFSLCELLPELPESDLNIAGEVSLLVAESDIFSTIHKIPGDIIVCDIDRNLLGFIELQDEFLRYLYEIYLSGKYSFIEIVEIYKCWFSSKTRSRIDVETLEGTHFLFSEENYIRSMEALEKKKIVTLDIDLFDTEEQKTLCTALKTNLAEVRLFNATNLPDYDTNNRLLELFNNIPWANQNPLIAWNIHDRGPRNGDDLYEHYPFLLSPAEYESLSATRVGFFADIDRVFLEMEHITFSEPSLRRYVKNRFFQEGEHTLNRKHYVDRLRTNGNQNLKTESICTTYQVKHLPRNEASSSFLIALEKACNQTLRQLERRYDKDVKLGQEIKDFFATWMKEARNCDLRRPQLQIQFKQKMANAAETQFHKHRGFDTEKHWICRKILNALMTVPIFGGIKYLVTGSYFFSSKTRRESMIVDSISGVELQKSY